MKQIVTLALVALIAGAGAPEARIADIVCDDRARLEGRLKAQYGARMRGRGLRGPDVIMEVWSSERTGAWALVQSYLDGQSCIVAMGDDWETMTPREDPA